MSCNTSKCLYINKEYGCKNCPIKPTDKQIQIADFYGIKPEYVCCSRCKYKRIESLDPLTINIYCYVWEHLRFPDNYCHHFSPIIE